MTDTLAITVNLKSLSERRAAFRYAEALQDDNPEEANRIYKALSDQIFSMLRMEGTMGYKDLATHLRLQMNPCGAFDCKKGVHDWEQVPPAGAIVCKRCGRDRDKIGR